MKYQRLDTAIIKHGSKRPGVYLAQGALKALGFYRGEVDGWAGSRTATGIAKAQSALGVLADAQMGKDTWTAVLPSAYKVGFKPPLWRRIQTMVSFFEVGNRTNAYGAAGPINDQAGCNYGVAQHNAHGSVELVLKMADETELLRDYRAHNRAWEGGEWKDTGWYFPAGRNPEVLWALREWFNSPAGIAAQDKYFRETTWAEAMKYLDQLPMLKAYENHPVLGHYWERAVTLMCDTMIQNGGLWSGYAKPFWRSLTDDEAKVPRYVELYRGERWDARMADHFPYRKLKDRWTELERAGLEDGLDKKQARYRANRSCMLEILGLFSSPELQLFVIAQMRARTSSSKWWEDVESRRLLSALGGTHIVHHTTVNLEADWGIGIDRHEFPDAKEDFHETFIKGADELFPHLVKVGEDGAED